MPESTYNEELEYLAPYQSPLHPVMAEIKAEGLKNKVPIVSDDIGLFLKLICSIHKPSLILEIGCGISYSTHWMLRGNPEAKVVAIDSNKDRIKRCEYFLERSQFKNQVELIHGWAEPFFANDQTRYDLIFQDATKKDYVTLLESCHQSLKIGGLFIADNIFFNGKVIKMTSDQREKYTNGVNSLKRFTKKISQHPGFDSTFLAYGDGVLIAKRIK